GQPPRQPAARLRGIDHRVDLQRGCHVDGLAGGFHEPDFTVAWPTGEFGAMGLEGAVRLGYRKELEAQPEGAARDALYRELVERQYAAGQAINMAATLEIDAVIDPAQTRSWLARGLASARIEPAAGTLAIDTW
ncbi:MAG: carbamoyl-phosphate synthase large subunit, partial [Comamonadaceae bacterium]